MPSKIIQRILAASGVPRLFSILSEELSASDLKSLLLAVYQARAQSLVPPEILAQATREPLFQPSEVDARLLHRFEATAFEHAVGFEAMELSPVVPLGADSALSRIDQNNVLTTIRNAEVLGDPTLALAVVCAARRKPISARAQQLRLCAAQRVIRMQPFVIPGFTPHFKLFGLVSAGRDTGSFTFETQALDEHIRLYLNLMRALNQNGFHFAAPTVEIADLALMSALLESAGVSRDEVRKRVQAHRPDTESFLAEKGLAISGRVEHPEELSGWARQQGLDGHLTRLLTLEGRLMEPLRRDYPEARVYVNLARLEGLGYYTGLCLRISPQAPDGQPYSIIDGGFTDWTASLLQDRKERLLTTGIGSEFACRRYISPSAS